MAGQGGYRGRGEREGGNKSDDKVSRVERRGGKCYTEQNQAMGYQRAGKTKGGDNMRTGRGDFYYMSWLWPVRWARREAARRPRWLLGTLTHPVASRFGL